MQEINILREKDIPYFERLEREGKAVILRFDSLAALSLFDFTAYLGAEPKELTPEDVAAWMEQEAPALAKLSKEQEELQRAIQKNEALQEMYLMTGGKGLPGREHVAVMNMIDKGMTKAELSEIVDSLHTDDEMIALVWKKAAEYKLSGASGPVVAESGAQGQKR